MTFTLDDLNYFKENNALIEIKNGGLLIGELHDTYRVKVLIQTKEGIWEPTLEMEGWEYIMNPKATKKHIKEINRINNEFNGNEPFEKYEIPKNIKTIDAQPMDIKNPTTGKLLLLGDEPQFIINKNSTKKYLTILDNLNKE
ncbi:MAG: Uncharacterised protein [Formosa sp. Hel1_33_131]|nr:MAG: Uncharacterised protein [Formosa sp. Hel1_33_131]|tara:strand:+ start:176 stop:601 length:426 start_codon:yes stop_codon:yes gene_type:complete